MAFFVKPADGFSGMGAFPFLKATDTGRKRTVCGIAFRGIPP